MIKTSLVGIALVGLFVASCGGDKEKKPLENTTPTVEVQKVGELKIAYYDQDSMKANFEYFKDQESIMKKKEKAFQSVLEQKQKSFQSYYQNYQKQAEAQLLSQVQDQGMQQNLQVMQNEIMQYEQTEGAKLEKETIDKLETISKKIDGFSKKYCEENGIDILMIYAKGGQFNYISPKMNVTKEFTAYLNQNEAAIQKEISKKIK